MFPNVLAYSCLVFLTSKKNIQTEYISLSLKQQIPINEQIKLSVFYNTKSLTDKPWQLFSESTRQLLENTSDTDKFCNLEDLVNISVGLQTSLDKVFIIEATSSDDDYYYFSNNGVNYKIEKEIVKPAIYKLTLQKYKKIKSNRIIIFPYKKVDSTMQLIDINELKTKYPECYKYLSEFKKELKERNIRPLKDINKEWYKYGRQQSISNFNEGEMLIWSVLTLKSNFVYSKQPILFTGGGQGPYYGLKSKNDEYSVKYIQAILNSPFISNLIEESSVYYANGYYSAGKQYLEKIPIRKIDFNLVEEIIIYDTILKTIEELEVFSENLEKTSSASKKTNIERQIAFKEKKLNSLIETLYGIK